VQQVAVDMMEGRKLFFHETRFFSSYFYAISLPMMIH